MVLRRVPRLLCTALRGRFVVGRQGYSIIKTPACPSGSKAGSVTPKPGISFGTVQVCPVGLITVTDQPPRGSDRLSVTASCDTKGLASLLDLLEEAGAFDALAAE